MWKGVMIIMADGIYVVTEHEAPEPIPVGMYPAKLASWEEKTDGAHGPYIRLEFEITEGEYAKTKRSLIASSKLSKGKTVETTSKLFKTITGLLGREPQPNEKVSLTDLVGTECQILVEDGTGDKKDWQDISKVMPVKK